MPFKFFTCSFLIIFLFTLLNFLFLHKKYTRNKRKCMKKKNLAVEKVQGLLFQLKLGTLIPLIPPFYCQLFPSYHWISTEFRICATVCHSNPCPCVAGPSINPPRAHHWHPNNINFSFSSLFYFISLQSAVTVIWQRKLGSIGNNFAHRAIRTGTDASNWKGWSWFCQSIWNYSISFRHWLEKASFRNYETIYIYLCQGMRWNKKTCMCFRSRTHFYCVYVCASVSMH